MNYWYYQLYIKSKGNYVGVIESVMDNFPISDVNKRIESQYAIDQDKIQYSLIQKINREDYHHLYAKGTAFNDELMKKE
jgi:hypothetical protein